VNNFCPILREPCIGRKCAMAVKLDHYNVSAYSIYWVCGLTHDGEMKHRRSNYIDEMSKYNYDQLP